MTVEVYEADAAEIVITVPGTAPVLGWASAAVERNGTKIALTTALTGDREVTVSFAAGAVGVGLWQFQVRAGANEAGAQTVHDDLLQIKHSIEP